MVVASQDVVRSHCSKPISTRSIDGRKREKEVDFVSIWGRVEEALHNMLSDMSDDHALFCCDAPPVFNDGKCEGKAQFYTYVHTY